MDDKLPVAVVMIARDEARRLPRSLGSVSGWVSELIVVTNDCADDTAGVAASFGATVSEHPFQNFRDQKAFALSLATQPWVLSLDADEAVTPELRGEIRDLIVSAPDTVSGAWLPRRLWFMGRWIRHGDNYPDRVLRLVRRDRARLADATIHERLEVTGLTVKFKNDLLHYSNESVARHLEKIGYYNDCFVREAALQGRKVWSLTVILRSGWRLFRAYFFRLGFLDGFLGLYLAITSAYATFSKYAMLIEHWRVPASAGKKANQ
ncbi:MAG: glycosyltransferase family 2 protein [Verrucomicrobiales bacterium]|jgi:glycosyltransferase involved in cell wall biosynthesis|nr:glycosyltransferase family 2 protein [Verrucomicrobiales bacterium]